MVVSMPAPRRRSCARRRVAQAASRRKCTWARKPRAGRAHVVRGRPQHPVAAVILGPDELAAGTVAVKDLRLGKEKRKDIKSNEEFRKAGRVAQRTVPRAELIATVQEVLAQYPE